MLNEIEIQTPPASETGFIDEAQMLARLPFSRGSLINYRNAGKIPFVRLGRRVVYFWPAVQAALLRMQTGGMQ